MVRSADSRDINGYFTVDENGGEKHTLNMQKLAKQSRETAAKCLVSLFLFLQDQQGKKRSVFVPPLTVFSVIYTQNHIVGSLSEILLQVDDGYKVFWLQFHDNPCFVWMRRWFIVTTSHWCKSTYFHNWFTDCCSKGNNFSFFKKWMTNAFYFDLVNPPVSRFSLITCLNRL